MEEVKELTEEDLRAALEAAVVPSVPSWSGRYARDMSTVVADLVAILTDNSERFMFGISEIDTMTRGIGRGELCLLSGLPHTGKTQLALQGVVNNPDKRCIIYTPDEVAELVLSKLVSIIMEMSAEQLEHDIRNGVTATIDMVKGVVAERLANLVVVDQTLGFEAMTDAMNEAHDHWGAHTDYVIMDYLEMFALEADHGGIVAVAQETKAWAKETNIAALVVHQSAQSKAPRGQAGGMDSVRYGGTAEANYIMEVFRRSQDITLDEVERTRWAKTVTVNLSKNKRPPSRTGVVDLYLDPDCGYIRKLDPSRDMSITPPLEVPEDADAETVAQLLLEEL